MKTLLFHLLLLQIFFQNVHLEVQRVFNVTESAPPGHIIGYVNYAASAGIKPNYYIVFPDGSKATEKVIAVEEISGEITTKSELDYEARRSYDVLAIPHDGSSAIHIYIYVVDENDNAPTFNVPSINIEISEFARLHSEISLPLAYDFDSPPLSIFKYVIVSGNVNNAFRLSTRDVNSVSYADLVVNGLLDREYRSQYSLVIEAIDGGKPPRKGQLLVNIAILDVNDNAPEFLQPKYTASIPTNVSMDHIVATVKAKDSDEGDNAEVTYSIVKNRPDEPSFFHIEPGSGIVRILDNNFEPGSIHEILVVAKDHGKPKPLESSTFLSVTVEKSMTDKSNLDFIWLTDSGHPEVYENVSLGYVLARISAKEPNYDSKISISVTGSTSICIKQTDTHSIYLLIACGQLDREYKSDYHLVFTVKDHLTVLQKLPTHFKVLDVNDNPPRFKQTFIQLTLNRSSDLSNFIQLEAKDPDFGENSRITYSIMDTNFVTIEEETGILHADNQIDCSASPIKFRVMARDHGVPSLSSVVNIDATIIDGDNKPPIFSKPLYDVLVKEDTEPGACLLKVSASSSCGLSSQIHYSLSDRSPFSNHFSIDLHTGTICLEKSLDYEEFPKYHFSVYAKDINGVRSQSSVAIRVDDVNDNSPIFRQKNYNGYVRKDAAIGLPILFVSATDADEGIHGEIHYRIVSEGTSFAINSETGQLYVNGPIAYQNYTILIEAEDGGGLLTRRNAIVNVLVADQTIPAPEFTSLLYTFVVRKYTLPGASIGQVEALGSHGIQYSIISDKQDNIFSIDASNGTIFLNNITHLNTCQSSIITIRADMDHISSNYTQVLIKTEDINAYDPHFELNQVDIHVREDQQIRVPFHAVQAYDRDRGKNGEIIYTLVQCDMSCPISIKPVTGELVLNSVLDYELVKEYRLIVNARDQGLHSRHSNITVKLYVLDVNDNAPVFLKQIYTVEVPEDAPLMTQVLILTASDSDSDVNAKISFYISEYTTDFAIQSHAGILYVNSSLDRESKSEYHLTAIASDHGQPRLSSNATIHIILLDVNDNAPNCSTAQSITLTDDYDTSAPFSTVVITDPDNGTNGTVSYRSQNDAIFHVSAKGEVSLKQPLADSNLIDDYILTVIASDNFGGTRSKSSVCEIKISYQRTQSNVRLAEPFERTIKIPDRCLSDCHLTTLNASNVANWKIETNDISKFFKIAGNALMTSKKIQKYHFRVGQILLISAYDSENRRRQIIFDILPIPEIFEGSENSTVFLKFPIETTIGTILTTFTDDEGVSLWSLNNKVDLFYMDERSSNLFLVSNFYNSNETLHSLNITRSTNGKKQEWMAFIEVEIGNFQQPKFRDCPLHAQINEDIAIGTNIAKIDALNSYSGIPGRFYYKIVQSSIPFAIDVDSGDIRTVELIKWHIQKSLYVVVEAENRLISSSSPKSATCVLFIDIIDVNDNSPVFIGPSVILTSAMSNEFGALAYITAFDYDDDKNGSVTYSVVAAENKDNFYINETTGELRLIHHLTSNETITVRASDHGNPSKFAEQNFTLTLSALEQGWSFFRDKFRVFTINAWQNIGTILHDFYAHSDERPQLLLISNSPGNDEICNISANGILHTIAVPKQRLYTFTVIATIGNKKIDFGMIEIHSMMGNQNAPKIIPESCGNISIVENVESENLMHIFAVDVDADENGIVDFRIVVGNENNSFSINASSGILSCEALDYEAKSEYFIVVTAEDRGTPTKADTCAIRLKVLDENDNAPIFREDLPKHITISDETSIGDTVARVFASDADNGANGKVIYTMEDESGFLKVHPETGEIVFAQYSHATQSDYLVRIKAEDSGITKVLHSTIDMRLAITKLPISHHLHENELPPFYAWNYYGTAKEGQRRGESVVKLKPMHYISDDALLTYSIISGNMDEAFSIDDDGQIETMHELDREIRKDYILGIIANGSHKKSAEIKAHIRILNINDNPPLLMSIRSMGISELAPLGSFIVRAIATDVDDDSTLVYSLSTGEEFFEINRYTGRIHLIRKLDYETSNEHLIEIQTYDGENISKANVTIVVLDENDNRPKFDRPFYTIVLPDNLDVGATVYQIRASDMDSGPRGEIYYNLSKSSETFRINTNSGEIILISKADKNASYILNVQAFDRGQPPLSTTIPLRISFFDSVKQANPVFERKSYSFSIQEDTQLNVPFARIPINYASEDYLNIKIGESVANETFRITRFGELSIKKLLDRENRTDYKFTIELTSSVAFLNASAVVFIQVTDENDNSPIFSTNNLRIAITDNTKSGEHLTRLSATDRDESQNGHLSYEIVSGNSDHIVHLNPNTGWLVFKKASMDLLTKGYRDLIVLASDGGQPSRWVWTRATIFIDTKLSSATAPFFVVPLFQKSIPENTSVGEVILKSSAINRIGKPQKNWRYKLTDNENIFDCDQETGTVFLQRQLDYEERAVHRFSLIVSDSKSRSAVVPVEINVLGVDESPPIFMKSHYFFEVPGTKKIGERIGLLMASDQDSGIDGLIQYEIVGDTVQYVVVEPETGAIVLKEDMNKITSNNDTTAVFYVVASSGANQQSRVKVTIMFNESKNVDTGLTELVARLLAIFITIALLVSFSLLVVFAIRIWINKQNMQKNQKQEYNVSRSHIAAMANLNRLSPVFNRKQHTVPFPAPRKLAHSTSSTSHCSDSLTTSRHKLFHAHEQNGRSAPQSVPDSEIDPDDISLASSVTDYLTHVGVMHNKILDQKDGSNRSRLLSGKSQPYHESVLNELIYAKVDEILNPFGRMNVIENFADPLSTSAINSGLSEIERFTSNPTPSFEPLKNLLLGYTQGTQMQKKQ